MACLKKVKRSLPWFNNNYDAARESGFVTSYVGICVGMESTLGLCHSISTTAQHLRLLSTTYIRSQGPKEDTSKLWQHIANIVSIQLITSSGQLFYLFIFFLASLLEMFEQECILIKDLTGLSQCNYKSQGKVCSFKKSHHLWYSVPAFMLHNAFHINI